MLNQLHLLVGQGATWPVVAVLFTVFILCIHGFNWRQRKLGLDNQILDARFWYSPSDAQAFLKALGIGGRQLYAVTQLTLDLVFPLTYGALFACFMFHVYGIGLHWVLFLPLLTVVVDLLENVATASLALTFDDRMSPIAWFAAICTAAKTVLFVICLFLLLGGGIADFILGV